MKKILLLVSVLAVATLFGACSKSNNSTPANTARVMFVNGSAGSTPVNVFVNSSSTATATNLAFLSTTGYQNITGGSINISFITASNSIPLTAGKPTFLADTSYSVFSGGLSSAPTFLCTHDTLITPASGYSEIRLVNLSSDALSLTAYLGSSTFATGVSALTNSSFYTVASGSYKIVVQDPLNVATSSVSIAAQTLLSGKIYTVIYTGFSGGGTSSAAYTATVIGNN